jgi:NTP pyrophosphatase (non-canonical NTP hydrolase)
MDASQKKRPLGPEARAFAESQDLSIEDFEQHVESSRLRRFGFDYYIHGLVEEAGEVVEATQKKGTETGCSDVGSELGDVLWYATALRIELEDEPLASWPVACEARATGPEAPGHVSTSPVELMLIASKLAGRAKKALRGDKALEEYLPDMRRHLRETLQRCAEVAVVHGLTLQQCAQKNVHKLKGRKRRGSILGDGNHR